MEITISRITLLMLCVLMNEGSQNQRSVDAVKSVDQVVAIPTVEKGFKQARDADSTIQAQEAHHLAEATFSPSALQTLNAETPKRASPQTLNPKPKSLNLKSRIPKP